MNDKKLTLRVDSSVLDTFKAKCAENDVRVSEAIVLGIEECDFLLGLAIAKKKKEFREEKEAQILKLQEELGYTESDMKKLLKNSKPAEPKPAKKEKVIGSRQAHKGTYDGEVVMWEVDKYNDGYYCHTSDGKTHKKDVNGNIIS